MPHLSQQSKKGFTLIETLVALTIYAMLIATLVAVNQNSLQVLINAEQRALAQRALGNLVAQFKHDQRTNKISNQLGRRSGQYEMSHFVYQWEIQLLPSENQISRVIKATIRLKSDDKKKSEQLASMTSIW